MLDGAYHFHHITGAVQVLAKRNCIPEMIVIAIPCIDYEHRDQDLAPTSNNGRPPVAAADKFLAFIEQDLYPIRIPVDDFVKLLEKNKLEGLEFYYSFMENEDHGTIVHRVFYDNLETLYSKWHHPSGGIKEMSVEQIREYYIKLSEKYGFEKSIPPQVAVVKTSFLVSEKNIRKPLNWPRLILIKILIYLKHIFGRYTTTYFYHQCE